MLEAIHETFDRIFKKNIERKSLINNMTAVILVIDELVDDGIIMALDPSTILHRIKMKLNYEDAREEEEAEEEVETKASGGGGGGLFASVFASAKKSLDNSLNL